MSKVFTLIFFAVIFNGFAQTTSAPKSINYQGVARDASGNPILAPFDIHFVIKNPGGPVHDEFQTGIVPNTQGIFSTQIGKAPNTLTLSAWDTGPFSLDVYLKTGNSFTLIGTQQLVSVPFALFAGNVPSSYTNNILTIGANSYSLNTGASITPTIIGTGIANVTPATGPLYSVNVPTPSLNYSSTGNLLTLTQGTAVSTATLNGAGSSTITLIGLGNAVVTPTFGSAFTVSVVPQVLSNNSNTISLSSGGGSIIVPNLSLTGGTGVNIIGSWPSQTITVPGATSTPWVKSATTVTLFSNTDNVGIGNGSPNAKLDVIGTPTTNSSILITNNINSGSTFPTIQSLSNGGPAISASETSSLGANAGEFNSSNGTGIYSTNNSNSKPAIVGLNTSATSNPMAYGIHGKTTNPHPNAAGILGENLGGGPGVIGTTYFPAAAVMGLNQYTTAASGVAHGVYGLSNNGNTSASGVYGENKGGGIGVFGVNTNTSAVNAIGVYGMVSNISSTAAVGVRGDANGAGPGVQGVNMGTGPAVFGLKPNTASSGNAGSFVINNSTNSADAIFASTIGSGAAIHAVSGTLTPSALSLWVENGHIKASGAPSYTVSAGTPSVTGGFSTPTVTVNGNDVKGIISFTTGVTGFLVTNFCDIKINFSKPYAFPPIVVATPLTDLQGLSYIISNVQTNSFILRLYRPQNMTVPSVTSTLPNVFNYIVIE